MSAEHPAAHTSEPIPGPDPGACPKCVQWRKAGMLHDCPGDTAAQDRRERDLAIVKRTLEFYGDPSTWGPDDWNIHAVNKAEYGKSGERARRALKAVERLMQA